MRRGVSPPLLDQGDVIAPGEISTAAHAAARALEPLRTEFEFTLPRGYVDRGGQVHRDGVMRLATARDELLPLTDERVRENEHYLTVVLLSRVIVRVGDITDLHPGIVEDFFAADLAFLQDLYRRINTEGTTRAAVTCPSCAADFTVDTTGGGLGEAPAAGWAS